MASLKYCGRLLQRVSRCPTPLTGRLLVPCRWYAITGTPSTDKILNTVTGGRAEGWLAAYEKFVGLTDVREAQDKVIQAEQQFLSAQTERLELQGQLNEVQNQLRGLSAELEKVHRGEERYLALLTQEHTIIKDETRLRELLSLTEKDERARFSGLSSAVRESHEKERTRTERTKYWSIIGSAVGAVIGILGTSINNYLRMRELRGIVNESAEGGIEMRGLVTQLSETMKHQHNQIQSFISDLLKLVGSSDVPSQTAVKPVNGSVSATAPAGQVETHTKEIMDLIKQQDSTIKDEMSEIKNIVASTKVTDSDGNVVYVGPIMENILGNTEKNLEWKMKLNSLWTVTFIYGAFALTIPILYNIFRGGS